MAWFHSTMVSIIKSVLPTGPKINQELKPLKIWTKVNDFSSGWLSGAFCHSKRLWAYIILQSNVTMWVVKFTRGVNLHQQPDWIYSRSIPSACLWRCFQKGLTKEKDPPWSRWDTIPLPGDSQWLKEGRRKPAICLTVETI